MLSKNRTVLLLVILVVVTALYFFLSYTGNNERNFRTGLMDIDTASLNRINISPPAANEPIVLLKKDGAWIVRQDNSSFAADEGRVNVLITQLNEAKVKNLAANSPDAWERFNATESLGTHIQFMENSDVLADLILGKFEYLQPKQQQASPYMRQPQGVMLSYARISGEDAVYTIDGMLAIGIGRSADEYRNGILIPSLNTDDIYEIGFNNSQGETFTLSQNKDNWFIENDQADSVSVTDYLKVISNLRGKAFASSNINEGDTHSTLKIYQHNASPIQIKAQKVDSSSYVLLSSENPTNYIKDEGDLMNKLFIQKKNLLTEEER